MSRDQWGVWSCEVPDAPGGNAGIPHGTRLKVQLTTPDGAVVDRLPAWIRYATVEDGKLGAAYDGIHWDPPTPYVWQHAAPPRPRATAPQASPSMRAM